VRLAANVVLVVGGSLLTALAAQVSIPLPFTPVPITGQTFAVLLMGAALGSRRGAASMALMSRKGWPGCRSSPVVRRGWQCCWV